MAKKKKVQQEDAPKRKPGRPKGSLNKRTLVARELIDDALNNGKSPLEVMLTCMRRAFNGRRWDEAAHYAAMAAPYVHPRLAQIDVNSNKNEDQEATKNAFLAFASTLNAITAEMFKQQKDSRHLKLVEATPVEATPNGVSS